MITLGFDASTTTVGYAFIENKVILDAGYIDISDKDTSREKAWKVINIIKENPLIGKVNRIVLESALSGFAMGKAQQQILLKLAKFNAVFEYIVEDALSIKVTLVNVSTARKNAFGKAREKGIKSKEFVLAMFKLLNIDIKKWTVINRIGNEDKRMEDVRDAIVLGLYENDQPTATKRKAKKCS